MTTMSVLHMTAEEVGDNWGYVFGTTDSRLSEEARTEVVREAILMYYKKNKTKKIKGDEYEGRVKDTGKHGLMGSFAGRVFEAELDTSHGKSELSFLVTQYINPEWN